MKTVYTLYLGDERGPTFFTAADAGQFVGEELEQSEPGDSYTIKIESITEAQYQAIQDGPEWGGW